MAKLSSHCQLKIPVIELNAFSYVLGRPGPPTAVPELRPVRLHRHEARRARVHLQRGRGRICRQAGSVHQGDGLAFLLVFLS